MRDNGAQRAVAGRGPAGRGRSARTRTPTTVAVAVSRRPASPNNSPTITGQDVCISPLNADHVFDLQLRDRDGDEITWTAEKREGRGTLHQKRGGPVAAGTTITIVYSPPAGLADENWITVTATDSRGGTAIKRLYVKNG